MRRLLLAFAFAASLLTPAAPSQAANCQYLLGFAALHELTPVEVGDCLDNEGHNPANGDGLQHTTNGLMAWRKADNWTAFTNGYQTWINGPNGLAKRLNTERFSWEANPTHLPVIGSVVTPSALPSNVKAGAASLYPAWYYTPGDVFPGITAAQVCTPGYASSVRDVSAADRTAVLIRYQITTDPSAFEIDHFVPLELGGSNALSNLWPQPYGSVPGAHEKDLVENYLHGQVCSGAMTLSQAQDAMVRDWYAVYLRIPVAPPVVGTAGHSYYASTYPGASTIYCDTDANWRSLSTSYLVNYPTLEAALAALPSYHLHQPC